MDGIIKVVLIALATLASGHRQSPPVDQFHLVELNHVHTRTGEYRFTQVIVWDRQEDHWKCQGWVKLDHRANYELLRSQARTKRLFLLDDEGQQRVLLFGAFKETRTAYDPEFQDRKRYPIPTRRGLTKIRKRPY